MERYSSFSDPVTGLNPYLRETRRKHSFSHFFTSCLLLQVVFYLPLFIYRVLTASLVEIDEKTRSAMEKDRTKIFACTSTSAYDSYTIHKIFHNVCVFMVTPRSVFKVSKYGAYRRCSEKEISEAKKTGRAVLFLSGGITSPKLFLDTRDDSRRYGVEKYLHISYSPESSYDIAAFGMGQETDSDIKSLVYLFLLYITQRAPPKAKIISEESLENLSKAAKVEIAEGMNMKTTEKFLNLFGGGR